jgi:hypothetical protein
MYQFGGFMALMKCPECGKEVSDKSEFCIQCGYPIHEHVRKGKPGKLIVHAPEYKFGMGILKIEVHIDGKKIGVIRRYETKEFVINHDTKVTFLEHSILTGTKTAACMAFEGTTVDAQLTLVSNGFVYLLDVASSVIN